MVRNVFIIEIVNQLSVLFFKLAINSASQASTILQNSPQDCFSQIEDLENGMLKSFGCQQNYLIN